MPKIILRQTAPTPCADGTVNVNKSDSVLISARVVASGGLENYNVADSVAVIKNASGTTLFSENILATESENITIGNSTAIVKDASGNVLFNQHILAQASGDVTIGNSTIRNSDLSYSASLLAQGLLTLPDSQINVNSIDRGDVVSVKTIDVNLVDSVSAPVVPISVGLVGNTLTIEVPTDPETAVIKALFKAASDTMETLTIDSDSAGVYTSTTNDGASGTITFSKNGGAFGAFSNPTTLIATDTLVIKRTITTGDGWVKITGTY